MSVTHSETIRVTAHTVALCLREPPCGRALMSVGREREPEPEGVFPSSPLCPADSPTIAPSPHQSRTRWISGQVRNTVGPFSIWAVALLSYQVSSAVTALLI